MLDKALAEMANIVEAIKESERLLVSEGSFELKAVARRADTYIIHLLGILDRAVYIGKSLEEPKRAGTHMAKARQTFVGLFEEKEMRRDQAIHQFLASC